MGEPQRPSLGAELQQLAITYSHLFLRAADAFIIWDRAGVICNANGAACLLTGYTRDQILGRDHRTLFPDGGRELLDEVMRQSEGEEDGTILYEGESEIIAADGELIPVTLRFIAVHHPEEIAVLGIVHDIRDLKDLEARLAQSQARYRSIVEHIQETILILDAAGQIVFVNYAGENALGGQRGELVRTALRDYVHPGDLATLDELLAGRYDRSDTTEEQPSLRVTGRDGVAREFTLSVSWIPEERNQPGGRLLIMHDITGLRELQEKLAFAERIQSVEDILSKITHEVKNPLAAINASAEFLRRHWEVDDATKREVIELIADETNRINRIITEYLRVRRVPRPTLIISSIAEAAISVEKSLERLLQEKTGVTLSVEVDDREFAFDGDMVRQILWNLVNNAIDAVNGRGAVSVRGHADEEAALYHLDVADTGCGMDKEEIKRAFDPFYTTKETGTGLGLALVRQQVVAMNGSVHIESTKGEGTTVSLSLPISLTEGP